MNTTFSGYSTATVPNFNRRNKQISKQQDEHSKSNNSELQDAKKF
jgi:hypothetical protein